MARRKNARNVIVATVHVCICPHDKCGKEILLRQDIRVGDWFMCPGCDNKVILSSINIPYKPYQPEEEVEAEVFQTQQKE